MTAVPTTKQGKSTESLEQRFRRLESDWTAATGHLSSSTKIIKHPAFQEIIGLGAAVIPFMLRDLRERPRLWVWALPEIAGANPAAAAEGGNIAKLSQAWLEWGREHGYEC